MYHEILPTSTHADPWLVYIPLNRSTCISLKKSAGRVRGAKGRKRHNALFHLFENASKVRRCTTKFSQLPHMRTSISPDPWLVYIPLNRSTCIRTFKKVCRSCERRKRQKNIMHCFTCLKMPRKCADVPGNSPNYMRTSISPDPWLVYIPLNRSTCIRTGRVRGAKGRKRHHCFTCLKMRRKCADVPRNSPNSHTCAQVYHLILG